MKAESKNRGVSGIKRLLDSPLNHHGWARFTRPFDSSWQPAVLQAKEAIRKQLAGLPPYHLKANAAHKYLATESVLSWCGETVDRHDGCHSRRAPYGTNPRCPGPFPS